MTFRTNIFLSCGGIPPVSQASDITSISWQWIMTADQNSINVAIVQVSCSIPFIELLI